MGRFRFFALGGLAVAFFLFGSNQVRAQQSAPIISDVISTVSGTSADFTWTATDEDAVAGVSFLYGSTLDYGLTSSVKFSYTFTSSGLKYYFSTTANNLIAGAQNYYKIIVVDTKNVTVVYTGSIMTMAPDLTAPVISRVAVAAQSEGATISWETSQNSNSQVSYYRFGGTTTIKVLDDLVLNHYVYLGNLIPGTVYYYTISSVDAAGNASTLDERIFKTTATTAAPSDVGNFELMAMDDSVNLSWKNPVDPNFDRVVVVKKINDAPASPTDGDQIYSGKAQLFSDHSVRTGIDYFYTVYSVNNLGNYSGGTMQEIVFGKMSTTQAAPVATVASSKHIRPEDLKFQTPDHQTEKFLVNSVVTDTPGANFSVHLDPALLPYVSEKMILRIAGQTHNSYFAHGDYHFDFVFHHGRNRSYIEIDYANGLVDVIPFILEGVGESISTSDQPIAVIQATFPVAMKAVVASPTTLQDVQKTSEAVNNFVNNEQVKQTVSQVVAPSIVGVTAVSMITVMSWVNILHFLQMVLIEPFLFFTRRRRGEGGQIYNSLDKMPVALATVRLVNKDTGKVVQSKVTDEKGRYSFVVNPGNYVIQVSKRNFSFPSLTLLGQKDDGQKMDIYHGNEIKVTEANAILAANIPLDPIGEYHRPIRMRWQRILLRLRWFLNWGGLLVMLASLYISPTWYMWPLLFIYLSMIFVSVRFEKPPAKTKNLGKVYNSKTNLPISQAVVRLYNAKFDKMVSSQITDSRGRYYFTAGDNEYYVTAEKSGFSGNKTGLIDLKGKENQSVAVDIALTPV